MAVVTEACIKCTYMECVEACPVDAFYEGENMLVINPDECICCEVCIPECPVEAIESDSLPGIEPWLEFNRTYAAQWPNVTVKKSAHPDAEAFRGEASKFLKYFSAAPGRGD